MSGHAQDAVESRHSAPAAFDGLWVELQDELRRLAHRRLKAERSGHTMSTTALVHEAYLKLASQHSVHWGDKGQFFALAAQAMRRLLIDHARRYRRLSQRVRYDSFDADNPATDGAAPDAVRLPAEQRADELIALDEALNRLAQCEPRLAQVVECRFFAGYTEDETAAALDVNVRTVTRDWAKARAWLRRALEEPLE